MIAPAVFIRLATEQHYHRLLTIGVVWHVTACRDRIPADAAVVLTATPPLPNLACPTCARDAAIKRARVPTVDLRPSVLDLGDYADLSIEVESNEEDWTNADAADAATLDAVPVAIDEVAIEEAAIDELSRPTTASSRPIRRPA